MKFILPLLFIGLSYACSGQVTPYEKAMIVSNQKDTLTGKVRWESELQLSSVCSFVYGNGTTKDFTPEELSLVLLLNDSIRFEPVNYTRKSSGEKLPVKKLARVLCKGYTSLYKLDLPGKDYSADNELSYILILKKGEEQFMLDHAADRTSIRFARYKGILRYALRDGNIPESEIEKLNYHEKNMVAFLVRYNKKKEKKPTIVFSSKNKTFLSHQVKAGGIFVPVYKYRDDFNLNNGTGFGIFYSLDIITPAASKRLYTTIDAGYFNISWPTSSYKIQIPFGTQEYVVKQRASGALVSAVATYRLTYTAVCPLLHLGLTMEMSNLREMLPYINVGAGLKANRFSARLQYEKPLGFKNTVRTGSMVNFKLGFAFLETKERKN